MAPNQIAFYPQTSGGGSGAISLISEQVLGTSSATITFSSIPQTFKHLRLVITGTGSSTGLVYANFNGDVTVGNYDHNEMTMGFSSTISGVGGFSNPGATIGQSNTNLLTADAMFYGYTSNVVLKAYSSQGTGNISVWSQGIWQNTASITSVVASIAGGVNFSAGTVATLYGIQ
jgi:hypothetical protein